MPAIAAMWWESLEGLQGLMPEMSSEWRELKLIVRWAIRNNEIRMNLQDGDEVLHEVPPQIKSLVVTNGIVVLDETACEGIEHRLLIPKGASRATTMSMILTWVEPGFADRYYVFGPDGTLVPPPRR